MTLLRCLGCCLLVASTVFAQGNTPRFDVASIHPSADQGQAISAGLRITGSQVRVVSLSLTYYIGIAYRLKPQQVVAPEWASQLRFDISGNIPDGSTREQVPAMLQSLLEERFQLKVHREMREFPVYALVAGKNGLKITGTPIDPKEPIPSALIAGGSGSAAGVVINMGGESSFSLVDNKLEVKKMTMAQVADALTRFTDRTVIDETGAPGRFEFAFDITPEDYQFTLLRAGVNSGMVLPPQAMRFLDTAPANPLGQYLDKLGLAMESRRAPLEVIVVDSALKVPLEN